MSITNVAYPAISISLIYVTASSNSGRSVLNAARWPPSSCTLPLQPKHTNMLAIARSGHIYIIIYKQKRAYTMGGGLGKGCTIPLFQWLINVLHFYFQNTNNLFLSRIKQIQNTLSTLHINTLLAIAL